MLADSRQHLESLFKWFLRLSTPDASAIKDPNVPFTEEDRARIARVLAPRAGCVHAPSTDWLSCSGLAQFLAEDGPRSPRPTPHTTAYTAPGSCAVCFPVCGSLHTLLAGLEAGWASVLHSCRVASSARPALCLTMPSQTITALHTDYSASWGSAEATAGAITGSVVLAAAHMDASGCVVTLVRWACARKGGSPLAEAAKVIVDGVDRVLSCTFYGHVSH